MTNASKQVLVVAPKPTRNGDTYFQTVTLTNNGTTITGPVSLVLDGLAPRITLTAASGTTTYAPPVGSPFTTFVSGDFGAGSMQVALVFSNPAHAAIKYAARILAGPAPR